MKKANNELVRIEKIRNIDARINREWLTRQGGWQERIKELEADLAYWSR